MAGLVSKVLSGLFNGISQQTPDIRLESQAELQENAVSSLVYGLGKRPPTEIVANLGLSGISGNVFMHTIIRDQLEQYILLVDDHAQFPIKVFKLDGTPCTVLLEANIAYLAGASLKSQLRACTVADYTFIANSTKTCALLPELSPPANHEATAVITVKSGVAVQTYKVFIDDILAATYTAGTSDQYETYKSTTIASSLKTQLVSFLGAGYTVDLKGSSIRVTRVSGATFALRVEDSWGNQAIKASKNGVPSITYLPTECWDDIVFKVSTADQQVDSYYKYFSDNDKQTGVWTETLQPGIPFKLNPATMPHALVRTGVDTFTFKQLPWDDRRVGAPDTSPDPSFVGNSINSVFMYRNRLGFLSGENCVLSKASDFFNFFTSTVMDVLDSDVVDFAVSADDVNLLRHAITFQETLILTSDRTQFQVSSGDGAITPSTVKISTTTRFETDPDCPPVGIGANLYFAVPRANYSSVREYFVQPDTLINDAADITAHCPKFLPTKMGKLVGSSNLDLLIAQPSDDPHTLYVYNFYWAGDKKEQSAWHKWTFDSDIIAITIHGSWLYMLVQKGTTLLLERMNLEFANTGTLPFTVNLDHQSKVTGVYSAVFGHTTFDMPFADTVADYSLVDPDTGLTAGVGDPDFSSYVLVQGDLSGKEYILGRNYTMRYRFSEWSMKAPNTNVSNLQGKLMARTITLSFQDTGFFKVEVTPFDRETFTYEFSATQLGYFNLNNAVLMSDTERFPCMGAAKNLKVDIINDSYLPSWLTTAAWEGFYVKRSSIL